jgi:hypothetical protein
MRLPVLAAGLAFAASITQAQEFPRWRFGVTLAAPVRVLDVNSNEVPDSNDSHVDLGLGFGLEATRLSWVSPKGAVGIYARASMAKAKAETGGDEWSPAWVIIGEAGARLRRQLARSFGVFVGAGVSHWSGPDDMAPFAGMGSILVGGDAGLTVRVVPGLNVDLLANATRIGADDERAVTSGFVWRFILGVHREK